MDTYEPGCLMYSAASDSTGLTFKDEPPPREVLDVACAQLGSELKYDGFRYLRSQRVLRRKKADLNCEIWIESSQYNVRGSTVIVRPSIMITSNALRNWKLAHPRSQTAPSQFDRTWVGLVGAALHNILNETEYQKRPATFEWNVANPNTRDAVVNDVVRFCRKFTLPYFALFEDSKAVLEVLIVGDKNNRGSTSIPGLNVQEAVEYALCFGTIEQASAVLFRYHSMMAQLAGAGGDGFSVGEEAVRARFESHTQRGLPQSHLSGPGFTDEIEFIRQTWAL